MGAITGQGFRPWLAASTASVFGDSVTFFAIGWAAAGFGADAASLVLTIEGIPLAVLVLAGGVLADRVGIRRTMAACDAAMVLVMAAFAVGAIGGAGLWMLVAVGALSGTIQALRRPAEGVSRGCSAPRISTGGWRWSARPTRSPAPPGPLPAAS